MHVNDISNVLIRVYMNVIVGLNKLSDQVSAVSTEHGNNA